MLKRRKLHHPGRLQSVIGFIQTTELSERGNKGKGKPTKKQKRACHAALDPELGMCSYVLRERERGTRNIRVLSLSGRVWPNKNGKSLFVPLVKRKGSIDGHGEQVSSPLCLS